MSSAMKLFDRGTTFLGKTVAGADYGTTNQYEGLPATFYDFDPDARGTKLSGMEVHAVVCRNDTGSALAGGELVTWTAAYIGRRVGAKTSAYDPTLGVAGVVDDFLAASTGFAAVSVADGDLFWLIQGGPTRGLSPADGSGLSAAIAEGDLLAAHKTDDGTIDAYVNAGTADATALIAGEVQNIIGVGVDTVAQANATASNAQMARFIAQMKKF